MLMLTPLWQKVTFRFCAVCGFWSHVLTYICPNYFLWFCRLKRHTHELSLFRQGYGATYHWSQHADSAESSFGEMWIAGLMFSLKPRVKTPSSCNWRHFPTVESWKSIGAAAVRSSSLALVRGWGKKLRSWFGFPAGWASFSLRHLSPTPSFSSTPPPLHDTPAHLVADYEWS